MKIQVLFIFLMAAFQCFAQTGDFSPKEALAVETFAYLKGQQSALEKIASEFPNLQNDVAAVQKKTLHQYGRSRLNIEKFLREELSKGHYELVSQKLDALIKEQLHSPIEKEEYARNLLEKISREILSGSAGPADKGILSFAYHDQPHQELTDGHTRNFSTEDHPKAEQPAVTISVPKSWSAQEAEHPAAVQQFTSYDGKGEEKILMMIYELAESDRNISLTEDSLSDMLPPGSVLIRYETVSIDGMPGIMAEVEELIDLPSGKSKVRMLQFMFLHKYKLYCIQGSVGPAPIDHNLEPQLKKYEPLFRLVALGTDLQK